jgi:hypothetical protein
MILPRGDEYIAAVQNPRSAFNDAELKDCAPESDRFGIPKPYSGGFTATFHMANRSREWAVRCFTRAISDLQERYAAIDQFLGRSNERFFVGTFYLSQGIRIGGNWFPIIKMQWVKGETLNAFIDKNIGNAGRIKGLVAEFLALVQRLQQLKVAHGDLQHGNIVVRDGRMVLIDYDGMFLPRLARLKTNEIGHPNYQHPGRSAGHYDASIDHFASIVIYLGLRGIAESPKLWSKYNDSESILFREEDFVDLSRSALLRDLSTLPALAADVDKFRGVCRLPFADVPDLDTFIAGGFHIPQGTAPAIHAAASAPPRAPLPVAPRPVAPAPPRVAPPAPRAVAAAAPRPVASVAAPGGQKPLLDASNLELLKRHMGQRVDVMGSVVHHHVAGKGFGRSLVLLNFGAYPEHSLTVVLRPPALKAFQHSGMDPQAFVGKRIKVSGVLTSYKGKPQIEVEGPAQIQVLAGGAAALPLGGSAAAVSRAPQRGGGGLPESVFDTLYAGRPSAPSPARAAGPAKGAPTRVPPPPTKASPARRPASRPAKTATARAPHARRTRAKGSGLLVGILVIVLLGVIGWAMWGLWTW